MLITLIVTQVMWPAIMGRMLFPLFRKRVRQAESDLELKRTRKRVKELEVSALRIEQESQQHIHEALDEIIEGKDKGINE